MGANVITLGRIFLAFVVLVLFQMDFYERAVAVGLTILVIYLDSLDGFVARKLGLASDFGALFDITGDRIVEHVYWIYFATTGLISFWVPIIIVSRSFLVDMLRSVAYAREGKTPFGEKTMMRHPLTRFLTASPFSRSLYAVAKVAAFVLLGLILTFQVGFEQITHWIRPEQFGQLVRLSGFFVWLAVALNLMRGIPVLIDGRHYLFEKRYPRTLKNT